MHPSRQFVLVELSIWPDSMKRMIQTRVICWTLHEPRQWPRPRQRNSFAFCLSADDIWGRTHAALVQLLGNVDFQLFTLLHRLITWLWNAVELEMGGGWAEELGDIVKRLMSVHSKMERKHLHWVVVNILPYEIDIYKWEPLIFMSDK